MNRVYFLLFFSAIIESSVGRGQMSMSVCIHSGNKHRSHINNKTVEERQNSQGDFHRRLDIIFVHSSSEMIARHFVTNSL